jgi:hypothetical protein
VLPDGTAETWEQVRSVIPDCAYLVGGTAIAVHLRHRVSRDLDFFLAEDTADTLHRLAGDRGDEVEILVDVQHDRPGELGNRGDEQIRH